MTSLWYYQQNAVPTKKTGKEIKRQNLPRDQRCGRKRPRGGGRGSHSPSLQPYSLDWNKLDDPNLNHFKGGKEARPPRTPSEKAGLVCGPKGTYLHAGRCLQPQRVALLCRPWATEGGSSRGRLLQEHLLPPDSRGAPQSSAGVRACLESE